MLRTFLAGAAAALVGSRLLKLNREGRFETAKAKVREKVGDLRRTLAESRNLPAASADRPGRPAQPPQPAAAVRAGASDEVSRPAQAAPWPADKRALPRSR